MTIYEEAKRDEIEGELYEREVEEGFVGTFVDWLCSTKSVEEPEGSSFEDEDIQF